MCASMCDFATVDPRSATPILSSKSNQIQWLCAPLRTILVLDE